MTRTQSLLLWKRIFPLILVSLAPIGCAHSREVLESNRTNASGTVARSRQGSAKTASSAKLTPPTKSAIVDHGAIDNDPPAF